MAEPLFKDKATKEKGTYIVGLKSGVIFEFEKISSKHKGWITLEGVSSISIPERSSVDEKYFTSSLFGNGVDVVEEEIEWMAEESEPQIDDIKVIG